MKEVLHLARGAHGKTGLSLKCADIDDKHYWVAPLGSGTKFLIASRIAGLTSLGSNIESAAALAISLICAN